ncbi:MAG: chorismate synthase [Bacteriovoracaceae bacterium]|jgi:chorismate synthase|nr:chorismate synthase [Bacteriovoracaceae bacterium]
MRFLTAGESHGKALVGIIEGLPSGLEITSEQIHAELKRRKMGYGRGSRQKIESDQLEILTGIRHGKSLGSPITLMIKNQDFKNWGEIMQSEPDPSNPDARKVDIPRPGHADLIGGVKYHFSDMRNVLERASARETAMRVGLGTIARIFLDSFGIEVSSRVVGIGSAVDAAPMPSDLTDLNKTTDASPVRCLDKNSEKEMIAEIDSARDNGDSVGGTFEVYASGVPHSLGSYVHWDRRIEAKVGSHFLSLNAIKGVEIGLGSKSAILPGSQVHDEMKLSDSGEVEFCTNKTGGIIGGMTSGDPIVIRAFMKPIATLMTPLGSVDLSNRSNAKAHVERSDYCAVPAAAVIGESLLCFILAESILEKFGGDSMEEIKSRIDSWKERSL